MDFAAEAKKFHRQVIKPRRAADCPSAPVQTADPDLIPVGDAEIDDAATASPFTKSDKKQAEERLKEETKGQTLGEWYEKEKKKPAPADDEWSEEAREKAAEARKSGKKAGGTREEEFHGRGGAKAGARAELERSYKERQGE